MAAMLRADPPPYRSKSPTMNGPHAALISAMVLVSAADSEMTDSELRIMTEIITFLPAFGDFDKSQMPRIADECIALLQEENGIDHALTLIHKALPKKLRETAYALACDVVAADGEASQEELQLLEMLRHKIEVDRLTAAAIERGARARFMRL